MYSRNKFGGGTGLLAQKKDSVAEVGFCRNDTIRARSEKFCVLLPGRSAPRDPEENSSILDNVANATLKHARDAWQQEVPDDPSGGGKLSRNLCLASHPDCFQTVALRNDSFGVWRCC